MADYLTTGEAAKLLKISRSTVSRKYDQGQLRGKTNPITGERMVSRESIVSFLKQYHMPVEGIEGGKKQVLLSSPDGPVREFFHGLFAGDSRIHFETADGGCEALVMASQRPHDLLILDEAVLDIACSDAIKTLRKAPGTSDLMILCLSTAPHRTDAEEWGASDALVRDGLDAEHTATVIHTMLGLAGTSDANLNSFEHQRQWPRVAVRIPVKISVYRTQAPRVRDPGEAMIEDISQGGALLSNIRTDSGSFPAEAFRIILESDAAPLKNWRAHAQVVRLRSGGTLTTAVQFVKISKPDLEKVKDLVAALLRGPGN